MSDDVLSVRWKVGLCNTGEACWCRTVLSEDESQGFCVISDGAVFAADAEHIVKLHNDWLEKREQLRVTATE